MPLGRAWTSILFSISILVLATGLYFVFDGFLRVTGDEIVKAWYFGQMVDLQEGQILSAIAKNQSVLQNSPFINSVVLVDIKDPTTQLFSIGDHFRPVSLEKLQMAATDPSPLTQYHSGFLANVVMARIPGGNMILVYEISSHLLIWSYLLAVTLGIVFVIYLMGLTLRLSAAERRKRESLRTDVLERLAHDLDSPLLSISALSLKIKKFDEDLHYRIEQAAQSIRNLLSETDKADKRLRSYSSPRASAIDEDLNEVPIAPILMEFVAAKRAELSSITGLSIESEIQDTCGASFVSINLNDFRRHLSNVFKNSIEATVGRPNRKITLRAHNKSEADVRILVEDNGCGIPENLIPLVGQKGKSLGGKKGKGLGLFFLLESLRHWRGQFHIQSKVDKGTTLTLSLPTIPTPGWYAGKPQRGDAFCKCIFVDDDTCMIDRWKSKLALGAEDFLEFNSADQFRNWFKSGGQFEDKLKFFFDYHLDGDNTGLALIDELGLAKESVLVTSGYMDDSILSEAKRLQVQIVPKVLVL